ncbi:polysaccharide pyruvyl transferase family protein [Microbacterium sp. No. 7]|uniref:polysaccharide pyruvyl transferase family protein n=1 Tax=Microbacterium sp. No. 7 TaxID=1714373 RepID=UPI0006CFEFE9|nr:polysaccharide pyruvyl transferase family protein [Microbacterium sp. No. 7]ALJ19083.1 hypothetical protein AOA12_03855 [Microbacterium sp. No. 7]
MIGGILWRARRLAEDAWLGTGIPRRRALAAVAAGLAPADPRAPRAHVLLCAPGGGNIGDQAMFEAFVDGVDGPVVALVRGVDDVRVRDDHRDRVTVVPMPALVYGTGAARRGALAAFARVLAAARSFSVVGADIMDGHYNTRASVARAVLAEAAARAGVDARVLGFSWNGRARRAARRAVAHAGARGVRLLARDPRSAQRLMDDRVSRVRTVADLVFAADAVGAVPAGIVAAGRPYALVNASALVARRLDLVDDYVDLVRALADEVDVVLVPHVSRPNDDDIDVCRRIHARAGDARVRLVDELLAPADVRALARGAQVVVTGRMHLAVIALSQGVPAIVLNTQGKVDGLADMFGRPELCLAPQRGFAVAAIASARRELSPPGPLRQAVDERLPHVRALSRRNTEGLREP